MNVLVVGDVVAPVLVRGRVDRVEPEPGDTEPLEVVEPVDDPGEVADAVGVRVSVRARVDLVDHPVLPPGLHFGAGPVELLTRRLGRKYEFGRGRGLSIRARSVSTAV